MKNTQHLRLMELGSAIRKHIMPLFQMASRVDSDSVELNYVANVLCQSADIRDKDLHGVIAYCKDLYGSIGEDVEELIKWTDDNDIPANGIAEGVINDVIKSYDYCVLGGTDLIATIFIGDDSEGKREALLEVVTALIEVNKSLEESSTVEILDQKDESMAYSMFASLFDGFPMVGGVVSGFNGNPFFIIGKWLKQWDNSTVKVLENRVKYLNLEFATLEASGEDTESIRRQKKYYQDEISDLESEIIDLRG